MNTKEEIDYSSTTESPPTNDKLNEYLTKKMTQQLDTRWGKSIGFTKPTLEDRVNKRRIKEKNRRKEFRKQTNKTR